MSTDCARCLSLEGQLQILGDGNRISGHLAAVSRGNNLEAVPNPLRRDFPRTLGIDAFIDAKDHARRPCDAAEPQAIARLAQLKAVL